MCKITHYRAKISTFLQKLFKYISFVLTTILSNRVVVRARGRPHPRMRCSLSAAAPSTAMKDLPSYSLDSDVNGSPHSHTSGSMSQTLNNCTRCLQTYFPSHNLWSINPNFTMRKRRPGGTQMISGRARIQTPPSGFRTSGVFCTTGYTLYFLATGS